MKHTKSNFSKKKFLIGTLFLIIGIGSSFNVAFADQDIETMLINWFNKQKNNSIELIEAAIMSEKETQMQRLKKELQVEIKSAEQQLNYFTEEEKEKRVNALRVHTDELIKNLEISNSEEEAKVINALNKITDKAVEDLEKEVAKKKWNKTAEVKEVDPVKEPLTGIVEKTIEPTKEPITETQEEEIVSGGEE